MAQPLDIIKSALRSIGALASGEVPDASTANDAFYLLNEMLDQWSNERLLVFAQQEIIHEITGGQFVYTIGPGGMVGASFSGYITPNANAPGGVLTVTSYTSGALSVGQVISGTGVTVNTAITALGTAVGGQNAAALGTYFVQLSQTVGSSGSPVAFTSYAPRPLEINTAIVRVVNSITGTLDYPVAILSTEEYELIGIKTLPGPWPRALYYQPTEPVGVINYWPNPSQGEMHLFCDTLLNQFQTINDTVSFPQGYQGALHWCLAELLMPEYGKANESQIALIAKNAMAAKGFVKRRNLKPQQPARFDDMLATKTNKDAGWILHGGLV